MFVLEIPSPLHFLYPDCAATVLARQSCRRRRDFAARTGGGRAGGRREGTEAKATGCGHILETKMKS